MIHPARTLDEARILAQAIVNTIREPLLVLDAELRVLAASRSFYETFKVDEAHTEGSMLYALGDGQWDIPALRRLMETIIPDQVAMDGFEVTHDFPSIGHRVMLLNARKVVYQDSEDITILLAFQDVTARRLIEREKQDILEHAQELLRQNEILLEEMRHRVANSLQIIAGILLLKARAVSSEETRHHLEDAHQRVMSVAAVQQHLHTVEGVERVEVGGYLTKLCAGLAASMVGETRPVEIRVISQESMIASAAAVGLGLMVTELVINALKYAFPDRKAGALILVTYEADVLDWKLIVSDNGVGKREVDASEPADAASGLGTAIVKALSRQLDARLEQTSSAKGLTVSITRASFTSHMPQAI